ncbi:transglutaminase domain-containing protein [Paenibacillus barengoltzii]|uniref:Transglutaminase-like superfamily protein n=1 Tax=Paenibacillus barengoltzii J12 TaxID=935846 RepID=A0ABY1M064_9BACL|nr:transglutaminase domain-containing protein [Paenibacillus barengoltzii]SMF45157.1 Transglutaminase-like superfamily protein [Paenibacillus barengoltzii J12]SMF51653.1 Transglutaminase-like superfamily protein [Paenibacillus barengoltzii]
MGKKIGRLSRGWLITGVIGGLLLSAEPLAWITVPVQAAAEPATVTTTKQLQAKLAQGMEARNPTITLKYKGSTNNLEKQLKQAVNDALEADPYTKYIVDRYVYSWRGTTSSAKITLQVHYRETAEQTAYVRQRVKSILKQLIQPGMNNHQKIKAIHDYVVLNLKYDTDLQKYTAYEGLKTGEAVCQGYALLTYELLKEAGIENRLVEGTAGGQLHAWNLVRLDNRWYHLDTTWDDPVPDVPKRVNYTYYLRTDEQMRQDHVWKAADYPRASVPYIQTLQALIEAGGEKKHTYLALKTALGYDLYDADAAVSNAKGIAERVKAGMKEGKATVTVRYAGSDEQLLEDLTRLYNLGIRNIRYLMQPLDGTDDLRVEIHWE